MGISPDWWSTDDSIRYFCTRMVGRYTSDDL